LAFLKTLAFYSTSLRHEGFANPHAWNAVHRHDAAVTYAYIAVDTQRTIVYRSGSEIACIHKGSSYRFAFVRGHGLSIYEEFHGVSSLDPLFDSDCFGSVIHY
jgi:hypothetical protein